MRRFVGHCRYTLRCHDNKTSGISTDKRSAMLIVPGCHKVWIAWFCLHIMLRCPSSDDRSGNKMPANQCQWTNLSPPAAPKPPVREYPPAWQQQLPISRAPAHASGGPCWSKAMVVRGEHAVPVLSTGRFRPRWDTPVLVCRRRRGAAATSSGIKPGVVSSFTLRHHSQGSRQPPPAWLWLRPRQVRHRGKPKLTRSAPVKLRRRSTAARALRRLAGFCRPAHPACRQQRAAVRR